MEGFLLLALLAFVVIQIAAIIAIFSVSGLKRRVNALEQQVKNLLQSNEVADVKTRPVVETPKATTPKAEPTFKSAAADSSPVKVTSPKVGSNPAPTKPAEIPVENPVEIPAEIKEPKPTTAARENYVFNERNTEWFKNWMAQYWLYALGGLTLALAGIYMVLYGIEKGYITPIMRVFASTVMGGGLVYFADWLRRRFGDEADDATAYLPSTIAAAGFSILFASALGAYSLYNLISANTSFALMVIIALLSIAAGLRFGLALSAMGVLGAYLAPIMVGQGSENSYIMMFYALLIMTIAMVVDGQKRSAWLSVFAMATSYAFATAVFMSQAERINVDPFNVTYLIFGLGFFLLTTILPERNLTPKMDGNSMLGFLLNPKDRPAFPTYLVVAGMASALAAAFLVMSVDHISYFWLVFGSLVVLALAAFYWLSSSTALHDLPLLPMGALIVMLFLQLPSLSDANTAIILGVGLVFGLSAALFGFSHKPLSGIWHKVAIGYPLILATLIHPSMWQMNTYWLPMMGLLIAFAAFLTFSYSKREGMKSLHTELAALSLVVYALILVFQFLHDISFTIAILAVVSISTILAHRQIWKYFALSANVLVLALGTLMLVDHGLVQAYGIFTGQSPTFEFIGIFAVVLAAFYVLHDRFTEHFKSLRAQFESWGFILLSVLVVGLMYRYLRYDIILALGIALTFLVQSIASHYRAQTGGALAKLRIGISVVYLVAAGIAALALIFGINPLWNFYLQQPSIIIYIFGYGGLALALLGAAKYFSTTSGLWPKIPFKIAGLATFAMTGFIIIRHFWHGADIRLSQPWPQGEIFTWTVILMILVTVVMARSIQTHSPLLRRAAIGLLLFTAAKVYFVDLNQTEGILRVVALAVFGALLLIFNFVDQKARNSVQKSPHDNQG